MISASAKPVKKAKARTIIMRWLVPLLGAVVALWVVFYLFGDLNVGRFIDQLQDTNPWWIGALAVAILLEQLIQGWKWRQLLYPLKPISSWRLTGAFLAGYGANVLVPVGISPLVRSWLVARLEGLRMATVLVTTAISRFIDGIVFAIIAGTVALAGQIPKVDGNLQTGVALAGALNLMLFAGALWLLFRSRAQVAAANSRVGRAIDWLAAKSPGRLSDLRRSLTDGIVWPESRLDQANIIAASFAMKAVAATNFLWAGLAVGVVLEPLDYLFLLVFAGFAMVLARFVRVPGGFVIGSGLALNLLGVPDEQALAMILFTHMTSITLVVGIGLAVLWKSGVDIRNMPLTINACEETA